MSDTSRDPQSLPPRLPVPRDDGAAGHLRGTVMPAIALPSTGGDVRRVDAVPDGFERLIIYAYPMTGLPGVENPPDWDDIPGARGCTPESCGFRDHAAELATVGAAVAGLSTQTTAYQREAAQRLLLPFPLLSDAALRLATALRLPTFTVHARPEHDGGGRKTLLKRLTMIVRRDAGAPGLAPEGMADTPRRSVIEHVFYPVFPPGEHASEVLAWLRRTG